MQSAVEAAFNDPRDLPPGLGFLAGGGEATRLILARDWTDHPLGPPQGWSEGLKVALSTVLNSPESMILSWGRDELTFFFNETYFPLLGPRLSWAMGAPFTEVWSDAWDQAKPIIDDAFAGRSQRFQDLPWKLDTDRGASDTWWSFSYSRILGPDGDIVGLFIFTNETTERVLADRSLAAERDRQRLMLQQMPGFVAMLSGPEHRFTYVNDAYVTMSGDRDFIGRTVRDVFPDIAEQGFFELLDGVFRDGVPFAGRAIPLLLRQHDGEERFIDLLYQPLRDDDGAVVGIFVGGYDVTDQIRAEASLRDLNDTLEQRVAERNAELSLAQDALRQSQKLESMGQLTGGVAHDFNNLLTPIVGSLDLLQRRGIGDARERRLIEGAAQSAERARLLVQRLLAFARRQPLQPVPVDVGGLVTGMADLVASTSGPQIRVSVDVDPRTPPAVADANQLEMAILNLAVNARDAMPDGGTLRLTCRPAVLAARGGRGLPAGRYARLSISDTGIGMDAGTVARAVEPFFSTKGIGKGTGLGLSMAHGLAAQLGGELVIHSQPGVGTNIELWLPASVDEMSVATVDDERARGDGPARSGVALLVDDEDFVRASTADMLTDLGFTVVEAASTEAALGLLDGGLHIDLLLTDHLMPGRTGTDLARLVHRTRPDLPTILVSGYAEAEGVAPDLVRLTKPFRQADLEAKIAEVFAAAS